MADRIFSMAAAESTESRRDLCLPRTLLAPSATNRPRWRSDRSANNLVSRLSEPMLRAILIWVRIRSPNRLSPARTASQEHSGREQLEGSQARGVRIRRVATA